jgi:septum formation inhibitor-activating ATPase MinD
MALVIGVMSQKGGVGKSTELKECYKARKPESWLSV